MEDLDFNIMFVASVLFSGILEKKRELSGTV